MVLWNVFLILAIIITVILNCLIYEEMCPDLSDIDETLEWFGCVMIVFTVVLFVFGIPLFLTYPYETKVLKVDHEVVSSGIEGGKDHLKQTVYVECLYDGKVYYKTFTDCETKYEVGMVTRENIVVWESYWSPD